MRLDLFGIRTFLLHTARFSPWGCGPVVLRWVSRVLGRYRESVRFSMSDLSLQLEPYFGASSILDSYGNAQSHQ
jgi:hypothetical protein